MGIFDYRLELKPAEYDFEFFYKEIQKAYWLHEEYDYDRDILDFNRCELSDKQTITRNMLAISQVEVQLKSFWPDLGKILLKPEVSIVGAVFGESEVRHLNAYSHLLDLMGLNEQFSQLNKVPSISGRLNYLKKYKEFLSQDKRSFIKSITLFTLFVENVSLFSQFYIFYQYSKYRNILTAGMATVVSATALEEQIHSLFGMKIINIIKEEYPDLWDGYLERSLIAFCKKAYEAECGVLDWILEDNTFIDKNHMREFLRHRFNLSMSGIGLEPIFEANPSNFSDYEDTISVSIHADFFNSRPNNYSGKGVSVSVEDLF